MRIRAPASADRRRRRSAVPVPVPSVPHPTPPMNPPSTPPRTPISSLRPRPRPDPPAPATCYQVAPRSGMDLPLGVGSNKEITAYGSPGRSPSLSCSVLSTELHVAAKESLFDHFKKVIVEEITKLLCTRYDGSISQEPTDVPESIDARKSPDSAETMDRTPPHFSQMAPYEVHIPVVMKNQEPADVPESIDARRSPDYVETMDRTPPHFSQMTPYEVPIPAAMENNSPYLALIWQNESHVTMIKLADDPSKQMEDFLSDNRASGRFSACYRAPIKSIQEASKSEILEDLNVNFDLHKQQDLERYSLSDAPKGPLKKKRHVNKPSKALSGLNQLKGNHPIDQAPPTNVGASSTSPLKKKRRRNAPSQKVEVEPINVCACPTSPPKKRCRIVPGKKVEVEPTNVGASPTTPPKNKRRKNGPNQKVEVEPFLIIQEASKSKILEDLNVHFDLHNQQGLERSSSKDASKGSLKKRRHGDKSNKALSGSNHLKGKHPIDQAPPTDVCASPTSPLKKKMCRNVSSQKAEVEPSLIMDLVKTVRGPCDAANSNSQQELNLVSSSNVLYTEKEKFPRHPRSNGSARTSINGWQWLEWHRNAAEAKKVIMTEGNGTMQSPPQVDDRAARLKTRNLLAEVCPELANYMQMKGRVKKLRIERSKIHGWGVCAVNQIKEVDLVVQYIGEVICKPISDMHGLRYEKAGICDYFFKIDVNYVIDATFRGGIARYINHSCEPNCNTRVISVNGKKEIFIYAKRLISEGEELTYNYNFPFDEKKIPCLCRSRRCRGSMN